MKTALYEISFQSTDTLLSTNIRISKREFQKQLSFLLGQLKRCENDEYPVEYRSSTHDCTGARVTYHTFTVGTADTTLIETVCKEGYVIKPRGGNKA